ncbi:MAG: histidine kinase dimerization/phospho-acceptor domain-containing protein [Candidatus Paceibacterota bacterium]
MNNKPSNKLFSWYYTTIIVVVLITGIVATVWTYRSVSYNAKKNLLVNISSVAGAFDPSDFKSLTGTESDLKNTYYISLKNKLEKIRRLNENVRFIYFWGYREDKIYFMVDSETSSSVDYSPPGQIYEEATQVEKQVLLRELPSAIEFNEDRWGSWLTALVPIVDGEKVIAVMGVDMSSSKYFENVYTYTLIPIISTFFVLLLIIIGFILRKKEEKYLKLKEDLISIATHDLRAPLTGISWLVDTILDNKESVKNEERTNLEDVNKKIKSLIDSVNKILALPNKKDKEK